tara:strand:- start:1716 stop:1859 length:144 start_codon:yes stop_codon:yes gene_type:complete
MSWTEQETVEYFYRETLVDAGVSIDKIKPLEDSDEALVKKINAYFQD